MLSDIVQVMQIEKLGYIQVNIFNVWYQTQFKWCK